MTSDCSNINKLFLLDIKKNCCDTKASSVDNVLGVKPVAPSRGGYNTCIGISTDTQSNLGNGQMATCLKFYEWINSEYEWTLVNA